MESKDDQENWGLIFIHDASFDSVMHFGNLFKLKDPYNNPLFNFSLNLIDKGAKSFI